MAEAVVVVEVAVAAVVDNVVVVAVVVDQHGDEAEVIGVDKRGDRGFSFRSEEKNENAEKTMIRFGSVAQLNTASSFLAFGSEFEARFCRFSLLYCYLLLLCVMVFRMIGQRH